MPGRQPTKNQSRMAQDMKRELIGIMRMLKDPRLGESILTVTRLDVTPDLDVAKVHVSVMNAPDGDVKAVLDSLNRASGFVRTEVSRRMHIRKAPRFNFVLDEGAAYAAHINDLLAQLSAEDEYRAAAPEEDGGQ